MKKFALVVLTVVVVVCTRQVTSPDIQEGEGFISLSLVADLGDSLDVEVRFDTVPDPSGIASIDWKNQGTSPVQDTLFGSTVFLADTFRVRKPALNSTDGYAMQARSVDNTGNVGSWSAEHPWAVVYSDTAGPQAPGILLDTVRVYPAVTVQVEVWPQSAEINALDAEGNCPEAPCSVQLYAAVLLSDGSRLCDTPPPQPGALYSSDTIAGCDSALALLPPPAGLSFAAILKRAGAWLY